MNLFEKTMCPRYAAGFCNGHLSHRFNDSSLPFPEYPECKNSCTNIKKYAFDLNENEDLNPNKALSKIMCHQADQSIFKRYKSIKNDIFKYVENGSNLFITTKNYDNNLFLLSQKLVLGYIWVKSDIYDDESVNALYIYSPSFLLELDSFSNRNSAAFAKKIKTLETVDLVAWDYINISSIKGKPLEIINSIIQKRLNYNKSNIFTGYEILNQEEIVGPFLNQKLNNCEILKISNTFKIDKFDVGNIIPRTPAKIEFNENKIKD